MTRPDKNGPHRAVFEKNKRRIMREQDVCGICGLPVDKTLRFPDPMSPVIDHIIPVDKGGHPSAMENLQLAHMMCNRQKADKLLQPAARQIENKPSLPQLLDWTAYRAGG